MVSAFTVVCGFGILLLALLWVGIPYQDPTPELRAQTARDMEVARTLGLAGTTVLAIGLCASTWVGVRWVMARRSKRSQ